jgi:TolB-like protein/DNA-binding winged helix-turn-helix (wHTH) protein/tetratricopeptide (TPR) repeat protein
VDANFRLGEWSIYPSLNRITNGNRSHRVEPKVMAVLCEMAKHPGDVVSKEVLLDTVWPGTSVEEVALPRCVSELRRLLDDDAHHPRYIETVAKRGYRLIAPISSISKSRSSVPLTAVTVGACLLVAAGALTISRTLSHRARLAQKVSSIAVLPLKNISRNPQQEYLADGLTEALISKLGKVSALRVISFDSVARYKTTRPPPDRVARELGVEALLEGGVLESGDQVRITVQLVSGKTGEVLWSDDYERNLHDVMAVQAEITSAIVDRVEVALLPAERNRIHRSVSVDPEAYRAYLKGRFLWNKRTPEGFEAALKYFNQAVARDRNFALAYSGLADTYGMMANYGVRPAAATFAEARSAATHAVALDDSIAESHGSLGMIYHSYDWNWAGAEREYRRALELDPNYPTVRQWYGQLLINMGHFSEGTSEIERSLQLDPFSGTKNRLVAEMRYYLRDYDGAIDLCRKTLEIDPQSACRITIANAYELKGMGNESVAYRRELMLSGGMKREADLLGNESAKFGSTEALKRLRKRNLARVLGRFERATDNLQSRPMALQVAGAYVFAGDLDQGLKWLERSYAEHEPVLAEELALGAIEPLPNFVALANTERYDEMLRRVKLPSVRELRAGMKRYAANGDDRHTQSKAVR